MPLPRKTLFRLVYAILARHSLSFRQESIRAVASYLPHLKIYARENIPDRGGYVATINHYTRPGFRSWWLTLSVSSALPAEVHWVTAAAWREPHWLSPATHWAFTRMAKVYNFTSMPPMPPDPAETSERAAAIREVIHYVNKNSHPVIGLAPEGGDEEQGVLRRPFSGAGRFMLHLARLGLPFLPIGIFEEDERLCLQFGPIYRLNVPTHFKSDEKDQCAADIVMLAIARQLPRRLQGDYLM